MIDAARSFTIFLDPIGLTIVLVYVYGYISRLVPTPVTASAVMGIVMGLATWIAMLTPLHLGDGIIMDLRALFVGVSGAFFGWRAAMITLCMAAAARLGIGGAGATAGVLGIFIAASMGLVWAKWVRPRITNGFINLPILSAMISIHLLSVLVMPLDFAVYFLTTLGPVFIVLNLLGTAVIYIMIKRERSLLGKENLLIHAATTDPLTKVLNRTSVIDHYSQILRTRKPRHGVAMICIDIDRFKPINDTYGHIMGDQVLIELAERISSCLRPTDLFARMGGDEFLIVLTNVGNDEANKITERCRNIIARAPFLCDGTAIRTTISVGSVWSKKFEDFEGFRDAADRALYAAKAAGRNCTSFSDNNDTLLSATSSTA